MFSVEESAQNNFDAIEDFFSVYEKAEPLSEKLVKELLEKGIPEKDLLIIMKESGRYCRGRNSFVFPPEPMSE